MVRRKSRRHSKGRLVNPTFFVFCEGQSEEEYVKFLRSSYKIPIEINSKQAGHNISQRFINNYLKTKTRHQKDEVFLMYDLDVDGLYEKLISLNGILLLSNPCLELWFLLHFRNQLKNISSKNCNRKLVQICKSYEKGIISRELKEILIQQASEAVDRSKTLKLFHNPSSSIFRLIENLETAKHEKFNITIE